MYADPYAPAHAANEHAHPNTRTRPVHELPPGAYAPRPGPSIELSRQEHGRMRSDATSLRSTHSRANLTGDAEPAPPLPIGHVGFAPGSRPSSPRIGSPAMNEKARPGYMMPVDFGAHNGTTKSAGMSRQSTTDREPQNSGSNTPRHPYGRLNAASVSDPHLLQFAEGDFGKTRAARVWLRLLQSSIVVRWTIFILPLTILLWIPGIIDLSESSRNPSVFSVRLLFWSIWLTIVWVGWWGALAFSILLPSVLQHTLVLIAPELRTYVLYLVNLKRNSAFAIWALVNWISFNPLVNNRTKPDVSVGSQNTLHKITQALFGIFIIAGIIWLEKLLMQIIARNFHKRSYEDRIAQQKFAIRVLAQLYLNSHDIGRRDSIDVPASKLQGRGPNPAKVIRSALKGVRNVATTGATALGTMASEIAGERVLQPNSPSSIVTSSLSSRSKSEILARRLFDSFVGADQRMRKRAERQLFKSDIRPYFANEVDADEAFAVLDVDGNGDVTYDEMIIALADLHRERLALGASMRDLDSAVGRLDQILFTVAFILGILIFVALLDVSFSTLITASGTFILGLSWLIGTTAQEILLSCIYLFVKHPYDVADRVDIDGNAYVVKEMHLLSTIFRGVDGKIMQMPHTLLNTKVITNIRRSGPISEPFPFDVSFDTPWDKIVALRDRMYAFVETETRDFLPKLDINLRDFAGQGMLSLTVDIPYKTNTQNGALKVQRRNKFLSALKIGMAELQIFGPAGAGNPSPDPADPTVVRLLQGDQPAPEYRAATSPPPRVSSADPTAIVNALGDERSVQDDAAGHVRRLSVDETDLFRAAQAQQARSADIAERRAAAGGRPPPMRRPDDIEMNARAS